jgi:hypothetical protein
MGLMMGEDQDQTNLISVKELISNLHEYNYAERQWMCDPIIKPIAVRIVTLLKTF